MKSLNSVIFKNSIRRDERIGKTAKEKFFGGVSFVIVFVFLSIIMIRRNRPNLRICQHFAFNELFYFVYKKYI